jgi:hypothetical protein
MSTVNVRLVMACPPVDAAAFWGEWSFLFTVFLPSRLKLQGGTHCRNEAYSPKSKEILGTELLFLAACKMHLEVSVFATEVVSLSRESLSLSLSLSLCGFFF